MIIKTIKFFILLTIFSAYTFCSSGGGGGVSTYTVDNTATVTSYADGEGLEFDMVYVRAGLEYLRGIDDAGDTEDWDGIADVTPANVKVKKGFDILKTEVTYKLWTAVKTWATANGYTFANPGVQGRGGENSDQQPVTTVNWRDSIIWCNALTEYYNVKNGTSLDCVYYTDSTYSTPLRVSTNTASVDTNPGSEDFPYIKASTTGNTDMSNCTAQGFRLPTTTEWGAAARWEGDTKKSADAYEYPASSGQYWTAGDYASGALVGDYNTDSNNDPYAWYIYNTTAQKVTHVVGTKTANALGLFDMSGNVFEWNFENTGDHNYRYLRGGSCVDGAVHLQVGSWGCIQPYEAWNHFGFRFCRTREPYNF